MPDPKVPENDGLDPAWLYGFEWGPMVVERTAHIEGRGYALTIRTEHQRITVFVTEKGRKIEPYEVLDV